MTVAWENCLGSDPALYARKVLRECGFTAPPICEKVVVDYLDLELKEVTKEHLRAYRSRDSQIQEVQKFLRAKGSWLQRWPDGNPAFGSMPTSGMSQNAWASSTSVVTPLFHGTRG
jgi:hypothetical protein